MQHAHGQLTIHTTGQAGRCYRHILDPHPIWQLPRTVCAYIHGRKPVTNIGRIDSAQSAEQDFWIISTNSSLFGGRLFNPHNLPFFTHVLLNRGGGKK